MKLTVSNLRNNSMCKEAADNIAINIDLQEMY